MSTVASVHGVLGRYTYPQPEITSAFSAVVSPSGDHHALIARIHAATGVTERHLALPLEDYAGLSGFTQANGIFIEVGLDLASEAISGALASAGVEARDVDLLVATSVTGIAVPSLDALLVTRLGMRTDVRRLPLFGLGCVAGAAGIARVHDYLVGHPDHVAVLVAVELCSLTLQRDDASMANIVASGLFGDGAAAVVMVGDDRAGDVSCTGPAVVATRSRMYADTARTMGWDIGSSGFRIVLSADVPDLVTSHIGADVSQFLAEHGLTVDDITSWVAHPGGPKVLEALQSALDLHDGELEATWRSLAGIGNLSSASVLHVLQDTMNGHGIARPQRGSWGLILAMGPGFCAEFVLVRW